MPQSTHRTAILHDTCDLRIENLPPVAIASDQIAIQPLFCGICGSDLHFYFESNMTMLLKAPHPLTGKRLPVPFGHEFSGIVTEVGTACRTGLEPGDLVAVMPPISDGTCWACTNGATNACSKLGFIGINGYGGGLSERTVVPATSVFKLPSSITPHVGALIEPLSVAWHAIKLAENHDIAASKILILGSGPIGCAVMICLLAHGTSGIVVAEPNTARRDFALTCGASKAVIPKDIATIMPADGFDVVFDCAGSKDSLQTATQVLRAKGTIINLAIQEEATIPLAAMIWKEAVLKNSMAFTAEDFQEVIEAVASGKLQPQQMITKYIRLEDVVEEGFDVLRNTGGNQCKILVDLSLK